MRNAKLAALRVADAVAVLTVGGPDTENYLGGPGNLFTSVNGPVPILQSGKNKLIGSQAGFGSLSLADLTAAHNRVVNACLAMVTAEARPACPPLR